ncbi:MAG: TagF domain-containing protein, partial [Planctomycetota bacterium]
MSREYPLTVYGKLPLSKEFLRLRCGGGAQRALYQWINEGHDASVARGNGRPLETDVRWRLVSFADGFSELNVGVIRGSTDHGGLRKFPFCVYVAVDRELLPPQPGPALIALAPLWDDLVRMEREISSIEALDAFKAAARDATVSFA